MLIYTDTCNTWWLQHFMSLFFVKIVNEVYFFFSKFKIFSEFRYSVNIFTEKFVENGQTGNFR